MAVRASLSHERVGKTPRELTTQSVWGDVTSEKILMNFHLSCDSMNVSTCVSLVSINQAVLVLRRVKTHAEPNRTSWKHAGYVKQCVSM